MLDDTSRKTLRILYNAKRVFPMEELARRSGRTVGQVTKALRTLSRSGFIDWAPERHGELKVLRGWENPPTDNGRDGYRWWEHD